MAITKQGDWYLRSILLHGVRSAVSQAHRKDDRLSRWITRPRQRSHTNLAAVALANKTVRVAWVLSKSGTDYQPEFPVA